MNAAAGTATVLDVTEERDPVFGSFRPTKTPRPGAGCSVTTVPPLNQSGLVCSLAAAQAIRIDWSGAVAPAIARPGTVDPNGPRTGVTAGTGSLPVAVQGGASAEQMTVTSSGPVTVNAGDGADRLNVISPKATVDAGAGNDILSLGQGPVAQGRAPWRVDAGTGDDAVLTGGIPDDSVVIGGPGDDRLDVATENTDGKTAISRQRVDCGDGADTAGIDARDVLGPACGPAPRAVSRDMTVGRFDETGSIRVSLGRLSAPARARVSLTGPRPPALSATTTNGLRGYTAAPKLLPRTGSALTTTITPIASVRRSLRTRRAPVRNVYVTLDLSAPGRPTGDRAVLFVRGVLRRVAGR